MANCRPKHIDERKPQRCAFVRPDTDARSPWSFGSTQSAHHRASCLSTACLGLDDGEVQRAMLSKPRGDANRSASGLPPLAPAFLGSWLLWGTERLAWEWLATIERQVGGGRWGGSLDSSRPVWSSLPRGSRFRIVLRPQAGSCTASGSRPEARLLLETRFRMRRARLQGGSERVPMMII